MSTPAATPMLPNLAEPGTPRLVSLIVPCRNEQGHIDAFCDAALAQQLPEGWTLELLVADGASDDGTRAALGARAASDARVTVLDNPRRIVSTGLNACLARARGEVVVRMDVHTAFAPDYVAECLAALTRVHADNVGGPLGGAGRGRLGPGHRGGVPVPLGGGWCAVARPDRRHGGHRLPRLLAACHAGARGRL